MNSKGNEQLKIEIIDLHVWVVPTASSFSFISTKTHGQNPIHKYLCHNVNYELIPKPSITDSYDIPCFLHDATTPGFSAVTLFSDKTKIQQKRKAVINTLTINIKYSL